MARKLYPIGIQTFERIRKEDKFYVDKTEYPVLHFDMSTAKHMDKEDLESELAGKLTNYEKVYGKNDPTKQKINQRLIGIIERAYEKTAKQVVILIDEYDAPLLDVVHEGGTFGADER